MSVDTASISCLASSGDDGMTLTCRVLDRRLGGMASRPMSEVAMRWRGPCDAGLEITSAVSVAVRSRLSACRCEGVEMVVSVLRSRTGWRSRDVAMGRRRR
jgi:hypothetical protein